MVAIKQLKKKWYQITGTKLFNDALIGETYLSTPEEGVGKKIIVNLSQLINDVQKQNVNIEFQIINAEKDFLRTKLVNYFIMPAALRKVARRDKDKIEASFIAKNKNDEDVRIKVVLLAKKKISRSISAKLQRVAKAFILQTVKSMTYDQFINELIIRKLQSELGKELKITYPLSYYEIYCAELIPAPKKVSEAVEKTDSNKVEMPAEA